MRNLSILAASVAVLSMAILKTDSVAAEDAKPVRVGIIGCDTSHVPEFRKIINDGDGFRGFKVVAAYPGGSDDLPASKDRVPQYTKELKNNGVQIVDSVDALLPLVDVVLLESVDGRKHLEQARPVFAAKKPVFIDKPLAGTLVDCVQIFKLAAEHNVPCFSASSLRYAPTLVELKKNPKFKKVVGCSVHAPCKIEPHHPDLFWYGVHGVETLFTVMGPGCETVSRTHTDGTDLVVGVWKDGRIGTFRGARSGRSGDYGMTVYGERDNLAVEIKHGYQPLVEEIAKFFVSQKPPVSAAETLEIFTFMEAADESKRQGGAPVKLADVLKRAEAGAK
jgi:predicted dehydrogenase